MPTPLERWARHWMRSTKPPAALIFAISSSDLPVCHFDRAQQRVGVGFLFRRSARHVALAVMAGEPAALPGEARHLAVVDHHRHAVFIHAGLFAFADDLVELRVAVD